MNREDEHFYDSELKGAHSRLCQVLGMDDDDPFPAVNGRTLELMYDHLISTVEFPFEAEFKLPSDISPAGDIVDIEVDELVDPDDIEDIGLYGLVCVAREGEHEIRVPLAEVVIKQGDPSYQLIEDYCIWYWEMKNP